MSPIRWTKQQDFCLRLGLLRALVAILPTHGRSVDRAALIRKLDSVLFASLRSSEQLYSATQLALGAAPPADLTVCDGLLFTSGAASWGQPIDSKKTAKILEWAHLLGLIGRGNQITERSRLMRRFFSEEAVARFAAGEATAWNPFMMTAVERAFLFFHLGEQDEMLWRLARAVGNRGADAVFSASQARVVMAEELKDFLASAERSARMVEMPRLKVVRSLSDTIFLEVGVAGGRRVAPRGPPKAMKAPLSRTARQTTKNADHQAIPRFEILVDLGFLTKRVEPSVIGSDLVKERNAWTFVVTPAAARFANSLAKHAVDLAGNWQWNAFGSALAESGLVDGVNVRKASDAESLELFEKAYGMVARRAGHTPFESAALLAMLLGLEEGVVVEIGALHELFLRMKSSAGVEDLVYFAAGNEVDRMFVLLGPNFVSRARAWLAAAKG